MWPDRLLLALLAAVRTQHPFGGAQRTLQAFDFGA